AIGNAANSARASIQAEPLEAAGRVPYPDETRVAPPRQPPTIGAERHAPRPAILPHHHDRLLGRRCVPDLHGPIRTGGGEAATVRTERHARDLGRVSFEGKE